MESILARLNESRLFIGVMTVSIAAIGYALVQQPKKSARQPPLPPGPPPQLLIGNLRQFPKDHFYDKFCEWQKLYGDIVYAKVPGTPMIILNSYELAQELLNKRPNTTASRSMPYMVTELMGWNWTVTVLPPGLHHSNQRKMLRRGIGPQRVGSYDPRIENMTAKLMLNLQDFEGDPHPVLLKHIGQSVTEITYGEKVFASMGEELSSWNSEGVGLIDSVFINFWLVDIFHFLRFIPSWFPGALFKRIGIRSTWLSNQIRYTPFEKVKELYKSGEIGHSIATDLLEEFGPDDDVRDALGILYSAGADTTTSAVRAFLYAMYLFPEVSERIHREVEAVTEGVRMPRIEDRSQLPFTEAVWKESWRWNCFFPLGIPHVNSEDEVINGYLVKAGTLININTGGMLMDPKVWGDPETFRPERFLDADAASLPNPQNAVFGFGVRVCPGKYLADRSGFHIAATMAFLYDIVPLEGRARPNLKSVVYTDTMMRHPVGFECRFISRADVSKGILKAAQAEE